MPLFKMLYDKKSITANSDISLPFSLVGVRALLTDGWEVGADDYPSMCNNSK